jgi:hypothetical protein
MPNLTVKGRLSVNRPERTIPGCREMSGDHFGSGVVKFDGDMIIKCT